MKIDINADGMIALTAKLERLNKSALPLAIRSTLNDCAFEMKKTNILSSAKLNMTVRNPTVFKKFTGVKRATGMNIRTMVAEVGFIPKEGVKGGKVPEGMEHNEFGGTDADGWMYMLKSRTSGSSKRLVRRNARYNKGKVLKFGRNSNIKSKAKEKVDFMFKSYESFTHKMPFDFTTKKGRFLVQATSFTKGSDGNSKVKLDFLMRGRSKFKATAKATHFNQEAAIKTSKQIEGFYKKNAEYQINKIWR